MNEYVVVFKSRDGLTLFMDKDGKFTNEFSEAASYTYRNAYALMSFMIFSHDLLNLEPFLEIVPTDSVRFEGYRLYKVAEMKREYSW